MGIGELLGDRLHLDMQIQYVWLILGGTRLRTAPPRITPIHIAYQIQYVVACSWRHAS